jgi:hypothetical protein
VVRIIAICAQPILLIVSWVTRNLFIGVDGLDVCAGAVFLVHHGRGATFGRVGGSILGSHVGCKKGEDWKGCLQQSEASKSRHATRVQWIKVRGREGGRKEVNLLGQMNCLYNKCVAWAGRLDRGGDTTSNMYAPKFFGDSMVNARGVAVAGLHEDQGRAEIRGV